MENTDSPFLMRDALNSTRVTLLADRLAQTGNCFDKEVFLTAILPHLAPLGLSERVELITDALAQFLPKEYPEALAIILQAQGEELTETDLTGFEGFILMPLNLFVSRYGLEHFELSMAAQKELTKRFSCEFSIRPFITRYQNETLALLKEWTNDPNVHVRRLVSEGTRPRLPWAGRLPQFIKDPTPVLELLELLKDDPELYVRRSVANSLNDIAKDHPDLVVETLLRWQTEANKNRQWIIRHASRTLLKQGHPGALRLHGYLPPEITVQTFTVTPVSLQLGGDITLAFTLKSHTKQALMIDYAIHHMKANGKTTPKVFKLTTKKLKNGEEITITKKHGIKKITTRTYYTGTHSVELLINGQSFGMASFHLDV